MTDAGPLDAIEEAAAPKTAAALLRDAYNNAAAGVEPINIQIYGYGEPQTELFTVCRYVADLKEMSDAVRDAMQKRAQSPEDKARNVALAALPFVSTGSYAIIGGERHDLPALGLDLYDELFPPDGSNAPRPTNDEQATWLLFHQEDGPLVQAYLRYARYQRTRGLLVEEEALGE